MASLKHMTYYLHPNMVFVEHIELNMPYLIWYNLSVLAWTKNFFPVESSSMLKKPLILWTIKYYLINLIIMAFEGLLFSGSSLI